MIRIEVSSLDSLSHDLWNSEVAQVSCSTYNQTTYSAAFEESVNDFTKAFFLRALNQDKAVGWLVLLQQFPYDLRLDRIGALKRLLSAPANLFRVFSWNYGPLCAESENPHEVLGALLGQVDSLARKAKVYMVRQAFPPIHDRGSWAADLDQVFTEYGYQSRPQATVQLGLKDRSLDQLWDSLEKDTRRTVRKARQQGVSVIEAATAQEFDAYYSIRRETARRNRLVIPSKDYFQAISRIFPRQVYKIFLSSHQGHWVSGQGVGVFNGNLILGGVCYSDYARENSIYGNDLVQWRIIEWAVGQGAKMVDWAGYFTEPKNSHEQGINRYKLKWGGEVAHFKKYFKIFAPVRYRMVELARKVFARGG